MAKYFNGSITVSEYVRENDCDKLWLCPNAVSSGRISVPVYLTGLECNRSYIPAELKDKKIFKVFREAGTTCIIWINEEQFVEF